MRRIYNREKRSDVYLNFSPVLNTENIENYVLSEDVPYIPFKNFIADEHTFGKNIWIYPWFNTTFTNCTTYQDVHLTFMGHWFTSNYRELEMTVKGEKHSVFVSSGALLNENKEPLMMLGVNKNYDTVFENPEKSLKLFIAPEFMFEDVYRTLYKKITQDVIKETSYQRIPIEIKSSIEIRNLFYKPLELPKLNSLEEFNYFTNEFLDKIDKIDIKEECEKTLVSYEGFDLWVDSNKQLETLSTYHTGISTWQTVTSYTDSISATVDELDELPF